MSCPWNACWSTLIHHFVSASNRGIHHHRQQHFNRHLFKLEQEVILNFYFFFHFHGIYFELFLCQLKFVVDFLGIHPRWHWLGKSGIWRQSRFWKGLIHYSFFFCLQRNWLNLKILFVFLTETIGSIDVIRWRVNIPKWHRHDICGQTKTTVEI